MPQQHALIIGGGLGGLATALRLSVQGWSVTVCEGGATVVDGDVHKFINFLEKYSKLL
jgi:phytoene dehydrogenase-like protein